MCLDAHAHGMRIQHSIFQTPHQVELTLEDRETPSNYKSHRAGGSLGATMPMWRVQTEGYLDGTDQLIGIVSRDAGFLDSPDVEWISGGVNSKGPNAVALARHGNFFHWGFGASPTYLTDEAKLVFVNAIHHIAKFDGMAPVARKVEGTAPREYALEAITDISDDGYAKVLARYEGYRAQDAERKDEIRARIEAGEVVSDFERQMLDSPPIEDPARLDPVTRMFPAELLARFDGDADAISKYLMDNYAYLYPVGRYQLSVDEQLKAFGSRNDDLGLIVRAVKLAVQGPDSQMGLDLLHRYTNVRFDDVKDWGPWLTKNRDDLFFSESAGYKWLINRPGANEPAPRSSGKADAGGKPAALVTTEANPLAAALRFETDSKGRTAIVIDVQVHKGWHAYGDAPKESPYVALELQASLPKGVELDGAWQRPAGVPDPATKGLTLLSGSFEYRCSVTVDDRTPSGQKASVTLEYQVCDEHKCLPPRSIEIGASVPQK